MYLFPCASLQSARAPRDRPINSIEFIGGNGVHYLQRCERDQSVYSRYFARESRCGPADCFSFEVNGIGSLMIGGFTEEWGCGYKRVLWWMRFHGGNNFRMIARVTETQ